MKRFWEKVDRQGQHDCWNWTAGTIRNGYGHYSVKGQSVKAHRLSWEIHNGPIPDGLLVCHHCDNPSCVNPGHLFLGTPADNMLDKVAKGRAARLRGERNPQAKLSREDVIEIRRLAQSGLTQERIGSAFGIDRRHVGLIMRRKSWRHVE